MFNGLSAIILNIPYWIYTDLIRVQLKSKRIGNITKR